MNAHSAQHGPSLQSNDVYLAFGSNIGDRRTNIIRALQLLANVVSFTQISSLYETEPVGYLAQPRFLNGVCHGTTSLDPQSLLQFAKATEAWLGRQQTVRNGPRTIDIDILLYDTSTVHDSNLTIPHPRMIERAFVMVPLKEIAANLFIPQYQQTITELLARLTTGGVQQAEIAPIPLELILHHTS
jgi:2-amino-4-hydroxy-6-hydroxymethyldihydropteridine diphosphokinase